MNWTPLQDISQLQAIDASSEKKPCLLFKHSTRCSISNMALNRIESNWKEADAEKVTFYYLDLLAHRNISNEIAAHYVIEHQSPQVLVISNGKCVYHASHSEIRYNDILQTIK
ncbi:MAG: bacillithiol system redox-active protein YtxJ [Bacteroidetes bacterium]|nr:bacillithiol system redox-active protein YtxJ [Bacteroidota bacterium]